MKGLKNKKIIVIILITMILCLTGCTYEADDEECIKYHEEKSTCYTYSYQNIGGSNIMIPMPYDCIVEVCDEYIRK